MFKANFVFILANLIVVLIGKGDISPFPVNINMKIFPMLMSSKKIGYNKIAFVK